MVLSYIDMSQPWVYMCSPSWTPSFPPNPIPLGHPSAPALRTLSHALNLDWQSVSHMVIHMFQCYYLKSSHPHLFNRRVLSTYYKQSSLNISGGLVSGHLLLSPEDTQVLYIKWMHPQIWKAECIHIRACVMLVLVHAKLLHSCLNLWNSMDGSPPGSSVHGILQARILEWVAMPSSRGSSQPGFEPVSLMSPALADGY